MLNHKVMGRLKSDQYLLENIKDSFICTSFASSQTNCLTDSEKDYLKSVKHQSESNGIKLESMMQLDLSKIPNICKGIRIFDGWKPEDLALFTTNSHVMLLQQGCTNHCDHCYLNADLKVSTIQWKNFTDLVDGMSEISNRLGFNPFLVQYSYILHIYKRSDYTPSIKTFTDSDPMSFQSKETLSDGKVVWHNLFDAANYINEKLGLRIDLVTAGWTYKNRNLQSSATNLAKNPRLVKGKVLFSIHPYHRLMHDSLEYSKLSKVKYKEGKRKEASNLRKFSIERRKEYVRLMSENLKTFLENDFPANKILIYLYYNTKDPDRSESIANKLYSEIISELKSLLPDKEEIIDKLDHKAREISYSSGRGVDIENQLNKDIEHINLKISKYNNEHLDHPINIEEIMDYEKLASTISTAMNDIGLSKNSILLAAEEICIRNSQKIYTERRIKNLRPEDILCKRKVIGIDGSLFLDISQDAAELEKILRLPIKLNFEQETVWHSKNKVDYPHVPQHIMDNYYSTYSTIRKPATLSLERDVKNDYIESIVKPE